jgi:hypothetical protein
MNRLHQSNPHNGRTRKHQMSVLQCHINSRPHTIELQQKQKVRVTKNGDTNYIWREGKEGMEKLIESRKSDFTKLFAYYLHGKKHKINVHKTKIK